MRRREFINLLLGGAAAAWPLSAQGQQPQQPQAVPVIGFLQPIDSEGYAVKTSGFSRGLAEAGYVEGQNVEIDYRWAEGHHERLSAMASDLVRPSKVKAFRWRESWASIACRINVSDAQQPVHPLRHQKHLRSTSSVTEIWQWPREVKLLSSTKSFET